MRKKKTHEEFTLEVCNLVGDEYIILSKYLGANKKIKMLHKQCGNEYEVTPSKFINANNRCPNCNKKILKTHEEFTLEVYNLVRDKYVILSEYLGAHKKIKMLHKQCGREYKVTPRHFLDGNRCPFCFGSVKSDTVDFKQKVRSIVGGEYVVLGDYVTNLVDITMKHVKCGNVYNMRPNNFLNGQRCPRCSSSRGEKIIMNFLDRENIEYEHNKRFDDCIDIRVLPFDFHIPSLNLLIEYDGIQHDEPRSFSSNQSQTLKNQNMIDINIRDNIKSLYAIDNNIFLIRINHENFDNIEEILNIIIDI